MGMRRLLGRLLTIVTVISMAAPVSAQTIGAVLMHGNTDSPDGTIALLAAAMEDAGYLVERPEMCWSHRRRRDKPFPECLAELEAPIARLTSRGARAIVVAGMSQGGAGALAFGARRPSLAGIIALPPRCAGAVDTPLSSSRGERRSSTGDGRRRQRRSTR